MKKILITGGAGFIGSNLALQLLDKGYEVTVLDNLSKQIHGNNPEVDSPLYNSIKNKVNFVLGDITDSEVLSNLVVDKDIIVHFAAETGTGQSMYQISKYTMVNIFGTGLLLDILANNKHSVKKVIVASSRAIYGEGRYFSPIANTYVYPGMRLESDMLEGNFEPKCPITGEALNLVGTSEDSIIHPNSVYGITKQNQEQMVLNVCQAIGISAVAFRYQNVYGPGQSLTNPYTGILSIFSTRIKNNNEILIFEDGEESRDFVYIDDVVNATILGIESENVTNEVFNVGSGVATSVNKVAETLIKAYGIDVPVRITGNFRLGDIRHNYADLTNIREKLGFEPKVMFEEGIGKFTQWVNLQEVASDNYTQSIDEMKQRGLFK